MKTYSEYKDSGVFQVGKIPNHWKLIAIKHLVTTKVTDGPHETPKFVDEGIPFLSVEGVDGNKINFEKIRGYITKELHKEYSQKCKPQRDDVFLVKSGSTTGKSTIVETDKEFNIWSPLCLIRSNQKKILPRFMFTSLQSKYFRLLVELNWSFGTQPNIGMGVIENLRIVTPPLNEQQKIVAYLNNKTQKIDQLIEIKEKKIALLKEKRTALINHVVTKGLDPEVEMKDSGVEWIGEIPEHWEVKRFRYVFNLGKGLTITKDNLREEGVFCVNYGEIHSKYGFELDTNTHKLKCVDEDYLLNNPKALINHGDFVFADTSEDIEGSGNFTYLESKDEIFAGYHTVVAKPKFDIESRFFAYEFESESFRNQIRTKVKGVKVYSITQSILKQPTVWYPSKNEQIEIVSFLDVETKKIKTAISLKQQEIEKLKEYKSSLINGVVTGKVKVC